jgi:glycosyltransferase involved in cell wall biosynthesis
LRELSRKHEVTLLSFAEEPAGVRPNAVTILREYCSGVGVVPFHAYRPASARALAGLFSIQPRSLVDTYSREMSDLVASETGQHAFDVVVASQLGMAPYALEVEGVPAILEEVELSVFRDASRQAPTGAKRIRAWLTWLKLAAYLRRILPRFQACTVASDIEQANLLTVAPRYNGVHVVPNALDLGRYPRQTEPAYANTLVFAGALTYHANFDGAHQFLSQVYPIIQSAISDVRLRITGSNAGVNLTSLPRHPGVEYTGYLGDIRPLVARSWASVVPLREGGGTRVKVLESMALGTPVVSTRKGVEGLEVTDGEHVLLADRPALFAARVVDLLQSPELRARLAYAGRCLVEERFDARAMGQRLRTLVDAVAA